MNLHQANIPNNTTKIIVRWRSYAFLVYLKGQEATFTKSIATSMEKTAWFHHHILPTCAPTASSP